MNDIHWRGWFKFEQLVGTVDVMVAAAWLNEDEMRAWKSFLATRGPW
ncbi:MULTISPECIES: hypothetical protein [unclassified Streptomyces]|nr:MULTISPECIES: hypothetical protein [unclassified Streptomyces]